MKVIMLTVCFREALIQMYGYFVVCSQQNDHS